jgi:transposase
MFFRRKTNKTGFCLQLVESFRDNEGAPRQRVLLSLGSCNIDEHLWSFIALEIENKLNGVISLFPPPEEVQNWVNQIIAKLERKDIVSYAAQKNISESISVDPKQLSHRNTRELGPCLAGLHAWNTLGMPELLASLGFTGVQQKRAAISVLNRLVDPSAEHAIPDWAKTTALGDLLGANTDDLNEDQFYRIADKLYANKEKIEKALGKKEKELFQFERTIFLYDLSNTYFEGVAKQNPKAKRGHSKEKRDDAPLLAFGLVLDINGFAIQHQMFSGNTADSTTLLSMIDQLNQNEPSKNAIIVVDSGIASEDNLKLLRTYGYHYIVTGKRPTRYAYLQEFQELEFAQLAGRKDKPEVTIACKNIDNEKIVFCKSDQRQAKEKAIFSKAETRYLQQLSDLSERIQKGRLSDFGKMSQALGRLLSKNSRVARYYETEIVFLNEQYQLKYHRKHEKADREEELLGCYYLRCSQQDIQEDVIWRIYMMLTRVESAFKALKSHLGLRPIYHRREDRCDSHIFITVLAYHLLHWIEFSLQQRNDMRNWVTIRRLLQTHAYTTIVLPSKDGKIHHVRVASDPDAEQQKIYTSIQVKWEKLPRFHSVI